METFYGISWRDAQLIHHPSQSALHQVGSSLRYTLSFSLQESNLDLTPLFTIWITSLCTTPLSEFPGSASNWFE